MLLTTAWIRSPAGLRVRGIDIAYYHSGNDVRVPRKFTHSFHERAQMVTVRFGACVLDARARRLTCNGQAVHLSTKAFDLLLLLVERRPAVVDKATLRDHLWPGVHVG